MLIVLSCLAWLVVLECLVVGQENPSTPCRIWQGGEFSGLVQGVWKRLRVEDPRLCHSGAKVPRLHRGVQAHGPQDRVGVG